MAVATVRNILAQPTAELRKAAIAKSIAHACPRPLTDEELEAAAVFIETHRDRGAIAIANMVLRLDSQARVCRGMKVAKQGIEQNAE